MTLLNTLDYNYALKMHHVLKLVAFSKPDEFGKQEIEDDI